MPLAYNNNNNNNTSTDIAVVANADASVTAAAAAVAAAAAFCPLTFSLYMSAIYNISAPVVASSGQQLARQFNLKAIYLFSLASFGGAAAAVAPA